MPNYIQTLKEENERLKEQLAAKQTVPESKEGDYDNLTSDEDGRDELVEIVYGSRSMGLRKEKLPLREAFARLVDFYSSFEKMTDRNVFREYANEYGRSEVCNSHVCYIKKSYKDKKSGQKVENLRKDVPLWLAVDDVVQKEQEVELISKKEYEDFYREHSKGEIRRDRVFLEKRRQQLVDEVLKEDGYGS